MESDTESVIDMAEVAMMDDLLVSEEVELGPDDKPLLSDDDDDDNAEGGDGYGNEADELMDGEGSSNALPPTEVIDDLSVNQLSAHTSSVFSVAVNATQPQLFATGGGDDLAYMWRLGATDPLCKLSGHTDTVSCLAYSSDGQMLATGGLDGSVRVWAVPSGELIISLDGPTQGINWLCWHSRGAVLLTGSEDATAWMWKLPEGNAMQIFSAHSASVGYGGFTNGGRSVVTASEDGTVRLWNPRTGTVDHCMHAGTPHAPVAVTCLGSHHTQPVFLFGGENGALKLAHAETGKVLAVLAAHESSVESVGFCDCMQLAASGGTDSRLCIWDLANFALRHVCMHPASVVEIAWRRDTPMLLSCSVSRELRLWDARDGQCVKVLTGHRDAVLCMALGYTTDGMYVVSGADDTTARVWTLDV